MITIEYLRSFRLAGFALFDFTLSFVGIYLLSPLLSKLFSKIGLKITTKSWMILTIPLSILIHALFGVHTPLTVNFFNLYGYYNEKIIVLALTYWGVQNIKFIQVEKK